MGRYVKEEECHHAAIEGEKLRFGSFYTHGLESYNWVIGFADMNDQMIYVPDKSILTGPDKLDYTLVLTKDPRYDDDPRAIDSYDGLLASLHGKEDRFFNTHSSDGPNTKIEIDLSDAMVLRFEKYKEDWERTVFDVKKIGLVAALELTPQKKGNIFRKVLEAVKSI